MKWGWEREREISDWILTTLENSHGSLGLCVLLLPCREYMQFRILYSEYVVTLLCNFEYCTQNMLSPSYVIPKFLFFMAWRGLSFQLFIKLWGDLYNVVHYIKCPEVFSAQLYCCGLNQNRFVNVGSEQDAYLVLGATISYTNKLEIYNLLNQYFWKSSW